MVGIICDYLMAMEIGKGKEAIIGIIYENKGKQEKRKVKRHIFACKGNQRKMKGNEKNRGINGKKASKKQLLIFLQF